jgi:hypothetical protein
MVRSEFCRGSPYAPIIFRPFDIENKRETTKYKKHGVQPRLGLGATSSSVNKRALLELLHLRNDTQVSRRFRCVKKQDS